MDDHVVESENSITPASTPPASQYGPAYYNAYYMRVGTAVYSREDPRWLPFFAHVADEIICQLNPRTVLDAGCAKAFLAECLRARGVEAYRFDVSDYALA